MTLDTAHTLALVHAASSMGAGQVWIGTPSRDTLTVLSAQGYIMGHGDGTEAGSVTVYFPREESLT